MKPPFAYYGGKVQLADRIAQLLPPHRHYVEAFAGSLAVLLAKQPSKLETVNDLDQDLMTFWRVLRDRPEDLAAAATLTPHSRAEHVAARDLDVPDDLERARRVWVLLSQGRTGTLRTTGWRFYADPAGTSTPMPGYLHGYVERMPRAAWRMRQVSLECRPALEVIADYGQHPEVCIYADPPYLGSTRAVGYRHELGTDAQHRELAEVLRACKASVVLSGYASPLYEDLYAGWDSVTFDTFTGQGTSGDGRRTEVLWSNRSLSVTPSLFEEEIA
jgi:DNA adenine methylase